MNFSLTRTMTHGQTSMELTSTAPTWNVRLRLASRLAWIKYVGMFRCNCTTCTTVHHAHRHVQEGGGTTAIDQLAAAISSGNVTAADVETSFRRLFRSRIMLGMLDPPTYNPYNLYNNGSMYVLSAAHVELARQAAREGTCLYKNDKNVLPLDAATVGKVAVVGPNAAGTSLLLGNYAITPDVGVVSILDGISSAMLASESPSPAINWCVAKCRGWGVTLLCPTPTRVALCGPQHVVPWCRLLPAWARRRRGGFP